MTFVSNSDSQELTLGVARAIVVVSPEVATHSTE